MILSTRHGHEEANNRGHGQDERGLGRFGPRLRMSHLCGQHPDIGSAMVTTKAEQKSREQDNGRPALFGSSPPDESDPWAGAPILTPWRKRKSPIITSTAPIRNRAKIIMGRWMIE